MNKSQRDLGLREIVHEPDLLTAKPPQYLDDLIARPGASGRTRVRERPLLHSPPLPVTMSSSPSAFADAAGFSPISRNVYSLRYYKRHFDDILGLADLFSRD
jgi:hypothetical protein